MRFLEGLGTKPRDLALAIVDRVPAVMEAATLLFNERPHSLGTAGN